MKIRYKPKYRAGVVGFEPTHTGVKVLDLKPLGDTPRLYHRTEVKQGPLLTCQLLLVSL